MLRAERQQAILELVKNRGIVAIEDLIAYTESSKATIRRDINELAEQSLLVKIRGGARFYTDVKLPGQEPSQIAKSLVNMEEKQRIAVAAKRHIRPNSCLFLDSGTTVLELAKLLVNEPNLTVVTNDIQIGAELSGNQKSTLLFVGGMVRKGFTSTYGYFAEQMLSELSVNQMFFSVDAVDPDLNITSYTMDDINVKKSVWRRLKSGFCCATTPNSPPARCSISAHWQISTQLSSPRNWTRALLSSCAAPGKQ